MFGDKEKSCFAIFVPRLLELSKGAKVPSALGPLMATSYPAQATLGAHREFLKPGLLLKTIPRGRQARRKEAEHTVYRRTLHLAKHAVSEESRKFLEEGIGYNYSYTHVPLSFLRSSLPWE